MLFTLISFWLLGQNYTCAEKEATEATCGGKILSLVTQDWPEADPAFPVADLPTTTCAAPFSGLLPLTVCEASNFQTSWIDGRSNQTALEVCTMQETGKSCDCVLPELWGPLVPGSGCQIQTIAAHPANVPGCRLDVGDLGRSEFSFETQIPQEEKSVAAQKREGRKGSRSKRSFWSSILPIVATVSFSGFDQQLWLVCSSCYNTTLDFGEGSGQSRCQLRVDPGGKKGISRPEWNASRTEGNPRQERKHRDEEDHVRVAQSNCCAWSCNPAASRAARDEGAAPHEMVAASYSVSGSLAVSNRVIRQATRAVQLVDSASKSGIAHSANFDPAAECQSCEGPDLNGCSGGIACDAGGIGRVTARHRGAEAKSEDARGYEGHCISYCPCRERWRWNSSTQIRPRSQDRTGDVVDLSMEP